MTPRQPARDARGRRPGRGHAAPRPPSAGLDEGSGRAGSGGHPCRVLDRHLLLRLPRDNDRAARSGGVGLLRAVRFPPVAFVPAGPYATGVGELLLETGAPGPACLLVGGCHRTADPDREHRHHPAGVGAGTDAHRPLHRREAPRGTHPDVEPDHGDRVLRPAAVDHGRVAGPHPGGARPVGHLRPGRTRRLVHGALVHALRRPPGRPVRAAPAVAARQPDLVRTRHRPRARAPHALTRPGPGPAPVGPYPWPGWCSSVASRACAGPSLLPPSSLRPPHSRVRPSSRHPHQHRASPGRSSTGRSAPSSSPRRCSHRATSLFRAWMSRRWMRHLGDISFGIFCVHVLVLHFLGKFTAWSPFTGSGHFWTIFLATTVISVVLAEGVYRGVERPLMRLRGLVGSQRAPDSSKATSASGTTMSS